MNDKTRGSVIVFVIALLPVLAALLFGTLRFGIRAHRARRAQIVADVTALSSMRIRSQALESVTSRWVSEVAALSPTADAHAAYVPRNQWTEIEKRATDVAGAFSGHKGRIRSVIRTVIEANEIVREAAVFPVDSQLDLGIRAESGQIVDENGKTRTINGLWLKRTWSAEGARLGLPADNRVELTIQSDPLATVTVSQSAVFWNALERKNPRSPFPDRFDAAVINGRLTLVNPYFRAEIHGLE